MIIPKSEKSDELGRVEPNNNDDQEAKSTTCTIGHSHLDHVTFGCATGGATEFNVIQNNCNVSQTTASDDIAITKYLASTNRLNLEYIKCQ